MAGKDVMNLSLSLSAGHKCIAVRIIGYIYNNSDKLPCLSVILRSAGCHSPAASKAAPALLSIRYILPSQEQLQGSLMWQVQNVMVV